MKAMEYAAMTLWLLIAVFTALGVHRLWCSIVKPKIVNWILLPGTLVAQLGHILGLLVTGGTVNSTSLVKDDESGEPQTAPEPESRLPVLGAVIIALLPLVGCAAAIFWVSRYFGIPILTAMDDRAVHRLALPTTVAAFFDTARGAISLVEQLVDAVWAGNYREWHTWLFLYLVICLTVRMAPFTGNLRGSIGAILLTGLMTFLIGHMTHSTEAILGSVWPLVVFSVAVLLLLLMLSLMVKAAVMLGKVFYGGG
jgi:hypothetical protein